MAIQSYFRIAKSGLATGSRDFTEYQYATASIKYRIPAIRKMFVKFQKG